MFIHVHVWVNSCKIYSVVKQLLIIVYVGYDTIIVINQLTATLYFLVNMLYTCICIYIVIITCELLFSALRYICPAWPTLDFQSIILIVYRIYRISTCLYYIIALQECARHATSIILFMCEYTCTLGWTLT